MSPFLFGTIGAAIQIDEIDLTVIPLALVILVAGVVVRLISAYLWVWQKKYTLKERIVIMVGWIPKATVQAAIGGVVLDRARDEIDRDDPDYDDYEDYGQKILTSAIVTILITAPLGAILTNNLGKIWLNKTEKKKNKVENKEDDSKEIKSDNQREKSISNNQNEITNQNDRVLESQNQLNEDSAQINELVTNRMINEIDNPDIKSKNKILEHISLKEFLGWRDRTRMLQLLQIIVPDAIDLTKETYI